jgi:hypothetical protein
MTFSRNIGTFKMSREGKNRYHVNDTGDTGIAAMPDLRN